MIFSVTMLHMDLSCFAAPYFHNFLLGWASHYHSLVSLRFPLSVSSHSDLILLPLLEILMTSWDFGMTCKSCNYMDHPLLKVYTVWYRVPWVAAAILSSLQKWFTPVSLFYVQFSCGYFLADMAMMYRHYPDLGGLEFVSFYFPILASL